MTTHHNRHLCAGALVGLLALQISVATTDLMAQEAPPPPTTMDQIEPGIEENEVKVASDPTEALADALGTGFTYRCVQLSSSDDKNNPESAVHVFRGNVRIYSTDLTIKCEVLTYSTVNGRVRIRATPAVGKRVDIVYNGMRAQCGLMDFFPTPTGSDVKLRRRPVIFQTDKSGRPYETTGHTIDMEQEKEGPLRVTINSKSRPSDQIKVQQPATVIVGQEQPVEELQGRSLLEIKSKGPDAFGTEIKDATDFFEIPQNTRKANTLRPGVK